MVHVWHHTYGKAYSYAYVFPFFRARAMVGKMPSSCGGSQESSGDSFQGLGLNENVGKNRKNAKSKDLCFIVIVPIKVAIW